MMHEIIKKESVATSDLPAAAMCRLLGVSRSGYYNREKRGSGNDARSDFRKTLVAEIHEIAREFTGYGHVRVTEELKRRRFRVNHKRILGIMRAEKLLCARRKKFVKTTDSGHSLPVYPNIAKGMILTGINQLWAADITYIRVASEYVYLAVIIDVFGRSCVGWELSRNLDDSLSINCLKKALAKREKQGIAGLVHHSDKGVQYASSDYAAILKERGIRISMSRKASPLDNAFAESFIKTVKYEEVYLYEYGDYIEAYRRIDEFIEDVYNKKRLHSSIGYMPPAEYEEKVLECAAAGYEVRVK